MAVSLIGILVLLGLLVGGVVVMVALLASRKTRSTGLALLGFGGFALATFLVIGLFVGWRKVEVRGHAQTRPAQAVAEPRAFVTARGEAFVGDGRTLLQSNLSSERGEGAVVPAAATVGGPEMPTDQAHLRLNWAIIVFALLALGAVYGAMKLVNQGDGKGAVLATGGLVAAGVIAVLVLVNFVSRPEVHAPTPDERAVGVNRAWDQITRPRIALDKQSRGVQYTVVVNGLELTFDEDTPMDDAIEQIRSIWQKDGNSLDLGTGVGSYNASGKFSPSEIGSLLDKALEQEREKAKGATNARPTNAATTPEEPAEPQRPAWVDNPPKRIGKVYRQVVTVGPFSTPQECYSKFPDELVKESGAYFEQTLSTNLAPRDLLRGMGVTPGELMAAVCVDEFLEKYLSDSVGQDMYQLHVRVEYDDAFRHRVEQAYAAYQRRDVVKGLTLGGVGFLTLIGGVFGLLKIDEATRGYYTKRLFLGVPAAIIGVFLLLLLLGTA